MKIREIQVHRLIGGTVDGGWPEGHQPEDDLHALVEVIAEDGRTGVGSVFTNSALVLAGVETLRQHWQDESAVEPERVSEKLRQSCFWQGRGGTLEHVISGIDIALWDLFGKVCGQPVSRLLGGCYRQQIRPYASLLFDEPEILAERLRSVTARGFRAIKLGWRPFGRRNSRFDEQLIRTARETLGPDIDLLIDAGGSEQFWPHGYKWALRTSQMLAEYDVAWFEERSRRTISKATPCCESIRRCRLRAVKCSRGGKRFSRGWNVERSTSSSRTPRNAADSPKLAASLGWRPTITCRWSATDGIRPLGWRPIYIWPPRCRSLGTSNFSRRRLTSIRCWSSLSNWTPTAT
ncbi:MAG: enolase C-terminal domain-like protein [Pirellulaceae bacterium]